MRALRLGLLGLCLIVMGLGVQFAFNHAYAAGLSANVSFIYPTQYSDDSALPITDIAFATIKYGDGKIQKVVPPLKAAVIPVGCGSTNFSVSVTTTATAKVPNAESSDTGPVLYASGVTCKPNPPTGLTVT